MDKLSREDALKVCEQIYELDKNLLSILLQRARLFAKTLGHKDILGTEFENTVLENVRLANGRVLPEVFLDNIMRAVNAICRANQETPTVYYLGPAGTYSEKAAHRYFGTLIHGEPKSTIREVIECAAKGGYGVVPYENSLAGTVQSTSDTLGSCPMSVVDIIALPIEQCLLTKVGSLADIQVVYSHEVSLMQCFRWLQANLPHAEQRAVSSNAEAMRMASLEKNAAAIGGAHGALQYQLRILREGIQDTAQNITKFLIICAKA